MSKILSNDQIREYEQDGVVFPAHVPAQQEVAQARAALETQKTALGGKQADLLQFRYFFHPWAMKLAMHFRVIGPHILLEEAPSLSLQEAIDERQELTKWRAKRTIDNPVPLPASTRLRWQEPGCRAA